MRASLGVALVLEIFGCGPMVGSAPAPQPLPDPQFVSGPPGASYDPQGGQGTYAPQGTQDPQGGAPANGELGGNPYPTDPRAGTPRTDPRTTGEVGDNPYRPTDPRAGTPRTDPRTTGEVGDNPYRRNPPRNVDPPAPPPPQPADRRPPPPERRQPPTAPSDAQQLVDAHNGYRAQHCAAPLTWSPKLAQVAQAWANSLRDQGCMFGHSNGKYGENLAAGTIGIMGPEAVVKMWYEEVKDYRFPDGGFSEQTGHFTQVIWRGTTEVGCGHSQCKGMDIWVCEYDPPGNWEGQYRQNVKPRGCK